MATKTLTDEEKDEIRDKLVAAKKELLVRLEYIKYLEDELEAGVKWVYEPVAFQEMWKECEEAARKNQEKLQEYEKIARKDQKRRKQKK